jgi:hypothetical protein
MKVTKNSAPKVNPPKGTHIAILTQLIDWGTQQDRFGARRKIEVINELPEETHVFNEESGEEPFIVDRKYAMTIGKGSALREFLEGMLGESIPDEVDLEEYLETVYQLSIDIEEDGDYENVVIKSAMPLGKSQLKTAGKYKAHGHVLILDLDNYDEEVFKLLPDWKQNEIKKSPEWKEAQGNKPAPTTAGKAKSAAVAKGTTKASTPAKKSGKDSKFK